MAAYAQFVVGPPGSGKTTYCRRMQEFQRGLGRQVAVVNLDPANDDALADIDVRSLVALDEVADRLDLGPNGALVYCMEVLEGNLAWLRQQLEARPERLFLFDCPGQVELYTHHSAVRNILRAIAGAWGFRVCTVQLVDSHYCADPPTFISVLLTSLATMLHLEAPHINVLSKIDLVEQFGALAFNLDFYTDVLDLSYLLAAMDDAPLTARFRRLNAALVELVEDFSLVYFHTLHVDDKKSMAGIMMAVDKAVGYIHVDPEARQLNMLTTAFGTAPEHERDPHAAQERYMQDAFTLG